MNPVFFKLVECVRRLNLSITDVKGKEVLSIGGNRLEFPVKLIELQKTLESLDKSMSSGQEDPVYSEKGLEVYRSTIEALVDMIKSKNQDMRPIHEIIEDAVKNYSVESSKKTSANSTFSFKPNQKKKGDKEIKLDPMGMVPGTVSLEKHKQIGYRSEISMQGLGQALEDVEKHKERARLRAQQKKDQENNLDSEEPEDNNSASPKI